MIRRILLSLPLWLTYAIGELVLELIGLVVIAGLLAASKFRVRLSDVWPLPTRIGGDLKGGLQVQWPRWAWLWSNEEDGVVGPSWYHDRHPTWSGRRLAFYWSALRNPVNNLRFVPWINPVIDPKRIRYIRRTRPDGTQTILTWQGVYSGLLVTFSARGAVYRFWIGWKLKPADAAGVPDNDMRKPRCGFALQLKRI